MKSCLTVLLWYSFMSAFGFRWCFFCHTVTLSNNRGAKKDRRTDTDKCLVVVGLGQVGLKIDATLIACNKTCDSWCSFRGRLATLTAERKGPYMHIHQMAYRNTTETERKERGGWEGTESLQIKRKEESVLSTCPAMVNERISTFLLTDKSLVESYNSCPSCLVHLPLDSTNNEMRGSRFREGDNTCGYDSTDRDRRDSVLCKGWVIELLDMAIDLHWNRHRW